MQSIRCLVAPINSNYQHESSFAYPYAGPGLPKSFTVDPVSDHYIRLPKVDAATERGSTLIWEAISEQTPVRVYDRR